MGSGKGNGERKRIPVAAMGSAAPAAPPPMHEWVAFDDPHEERHWLFDVTFLASNWACIFGQGCQGVLTGPTPEMAQGCCSYGAHFTDPDDAARVTAAAATLTPEQWQFHDRGRRKRVTKVTKEGETVTRMAEGACIFLNRPGFPGGPGCALHRAALERSERPLDLKPNVCWQLPLRREDTTEPDGWVTSRVFGWDRRHWGEGGDEFHWWCTDAPDAFVGRVAVWTSMREELVELVGQEVYDLLAGYMTRKARGPRFLPHPATQPAPLRAGG